MNRQPTDIYARLMADHMETLQGNATAGVAVEQGTWPHGTRTAQFAGHVPTATVGQSGTLPGSWQDPQIHLMTAAAGRSCHYYDVVDFIGRDVVEEEVVAGTNDGNHIVVKSGVKPKIESITLSQWSIASLAILFQAPGGGKVEVSRDHRLSVVHDQAISANSAVRKRVRICVRLRVQKATVGPWFPLGDRYPPLAHNATDPPCSPQPRPSPRPCPR